MNLYFTAILPLIGVVVGFLAKPFQDWIQILLNRKENLKSKKEKLIEEIFMLLPDINEKINDVNHILVQRVLGAEPTKSPYNKDKYSISIRRIQYILKFELSVPESVWENFRAFEDNVLLSEYILLHELSSKAGLAPDTNPLNKLISEVVQGHRGDYKETARSYLQQAQSKANILSDIIENCLKQEKQCVDKKGHNKSK